MTGFLLSAISPSVSTNCLKAGQQLNEVSGEGGRGGRGGWGDWATDIKEFLFERIVEGGPNSYLIRTTICLSMDWQR